MGQNKSIKTTLILLFVLIHIVIIGSGNTVSQGSSGPKLISGRVYTSEGEHPGYNFVGAYAAVIVEHEGIKTTYVDSNGLELDDNDDYWYAVVIPEGNWEEGDTYWIKVDGTGWGDDNDICAAHDLPDANSFIMGDTGSEWQDVNTVKTADDVKQTGSQFFIFIFIGLICPIVIIIIVVLYLRSKNKQKNP